MHGLIAARTVSVPGIASAKFRTMRKAVAFLARVLWRMFSHAIRVTPKLFRLSVKWSKIGQIVSSVSGVIGHIVPQLAVVASRAGPATSRSILQGRARLATIRSLGHKHVRPMRALRRSVEIAGGALGQSGVLAVIVVDKRCADARLKNSRTTVVGDAIPGMEKRQLSAQEIALGPAIAHGLNGRPLAIAPPRDADPTCRSGTDL